MSSLSAVRHILVEIGLPEDVLAPDRALRADLGLDSTETTELGLALDKRHGVMVDLWDRHDYTIEELDRLVADTGKQASS